MRKGMGDWFDDMIGSSSGTPSGSEVIDLTGNTSSLPPAAVPAPPITLVSPTKKQLPSMLSKLFGALNGAFIPTPAQSAATARAAYNPSLLTQVGSAVTSPLFRAGGINFTLGGLALGGGGILLLAVTRRKRK